MPNTQTDVLPAEASSRDIAPNSKPYPTGSVCAATSRMAFKACPELYPAAGAPLTAMDGKRLKRDRDSEP